MPDQYGRITGNDWMNLANTVNQISGNIRKNQQEADVNTNLSLLRQSKGDYESFQPVGSQKSQVEAGRLYATDLQNQQIIKGSRDTQEQEQILGKLITWGQENPNASIDKIPKAFYPGVNGQRALVSFTNMRMNTEEGKARTQAAINARVKEAYPIFAAQRDYVQKALVSGDFDTAVNILQDMSSQLPIPYKFGDFDKESQTFEVQYLDSETGEYQPSGRRSMRSVLNQINKTGEEQFARGLTLHAMAVDAGNREKRENPLHGKNARGDRFIIIPKKQTTNPNQVVYEVRDEKTNEEVNFPSLKAMNDFGIYTENLDREQDLQKIATSKAAMRSYDRSNRGGAGGMKWSSRTMYKDDKEFKPRNVFEERSYLNKGWSLEKPSGPGEYTKTKDRMVYEQQAVDALGPAAEPAEINKAKAKAGTEWQARVDGWKKVHNPTTGEQGYQTPDGVVDVYGNPITKKQVETQKEKPKQEPKPKRESRYPQKSSKYGSRKDGTQKGSGYYGEIKNPDGSISTEISIGVNIDGKEIEIPALVPGLTKKEIETLQSIRSPKDIPKSIVDKAVAHAKNRIKKGLSPFAQKGEQTEASPALLQMRQNQIQPMSGYQQPMDDYVPLILKKRPRN